MTLFRARCGLTRVGFLLFLVLVPSARGGDKPLLSLDDQGRIQPFGWIQLWNVYSRHVRDETNAPVDDRWDLFFRRARLGLEGRIRERLDYYLAFSYQGVGKNAYTAAPGHAQDRANDEFRLWDAYVTWAVDPTWLNITAGYLKPHAGRENNTSGFKVESFGKGLTSAFLREHVVDTSAGRETGINVGGMYQPGALGFHYYLGLFDVDHDAADGKAGGKDASPMAAARAAFTVGDPEWDGYSLGYEENYFGRRKGITLGGSYTVQGKTDAFQRNESLGVDLLANWGPWNLSAEQAWLKRDGGDFSYTDRVYHVRGGRNFPLSCGWVLEPVFMFTRFNGDARSADHPGEIREMQDLGVNAYLDQERIKVTLHYVWQDGEGYGGDFLGLGVQLFF